MSGIQESIYHTTPMVMMPIFADQHLNTHNIRDQGIAIFIPWEEATVQILKEAVIELITNDK